MGVAARLKTNAVPENRGRCAADQGAIGQGSSRQISEAYCCIARSDENLPARATLMIAIRSHASRSW